MLQLFLRASCSLSFLILMLAEPQIGHAQQVGAAWYKNAAPEKCVSYIAWNNSPEKPIEGNATQALMAEPEVRAFVDDMRVRAGLLGPAMMGEELPKEKIELLHALSPMLVASIFERSGCMFVEELTVAQNMETAPVVKVAMLVDMGDKAEEFVSQMLKLVTEENRKTPEVNLAGTKAYSIELEESAGTLYFGNAGQVLVIAIGEETYASAIKRMKGSSQPAWLTKLDERAKSLNHVHSLAFMDVKTLLNSIQTIGGPQANMASDLLGLSNVEEVQMVSGLDDTGSVTHVLFDAVKVEGLLGVLTKNPVKDSLFENIPKDSLGAMAMTLDNEGVFELIRSLESIMGGGGPADFDRFKQEFRNETGVDFEDDLLRNLGDSWVLFNGASDGWLSGLTLVGEVTDAKKLSAAVEKFFTTVGEKVKQMPAYYRPGLFKQAYEGETIYSMTFPDVFVETSFCIKEDRIFIGLFPQAVKTAIKGLPAEQVMLDDMQVKKLSESKFLKGSARLSGMIYVDAKLQSQITYPYLQIFKTIGSSMSPRQMTPEMSALLSGVELPPARTVIPKIKPTMVLMRTSEQGIEIEARQTIPSNSAVLGVPVMVGMLLPAVGQVRKTAKEQQSLNNLKQISLASLNHESAHMRWPTDKPKGKSKHSFSWRVHILPYIEQNNIYNQIKFDEPYDSDHNKAVLAKTPEVFKSPLRKLPEGMTVYRGFKSDGKGGARGVLGGINGKGSRIGGVTDGTSNTILVAEVPDSMAVHWAQPGCLNVDDETVKKLLASKGFMLTAFCDGSVHKNSNDN